MGGRRAVFVADDAQAAQLARLGFVAVRALDSDIDAALIDAALIGDVRRTAPDARIVLMVGADVEAAGRALIFDDVAFVGSPPADSELLVALAAMQRRPTSFAEEQGGYALRLAALGEEIARIARAIDPPAALAGAPPVPQSPLAFDPATVRAVLRARRQRDTLFPAGTFADPVWDMLLDLTAARGEGKPVSVSSLAIAASVPTTTALRHLKAMIDTGLVIRRNDPEDGRRIYIDLSDDAFARMRAWVAATNKAV